MSAAVRKACLSLPDVTLLCVETRRTALARIAMDRCLGNIEFGDAVMLTSHPCDVGLDIRVECIDAFIDIDGYSRFMVHDLHRHITTSHVLVVQWDGFVVDATRWREQFLAFDYIGAPWPDGRVGNGGFSLRSRRLLEALADLRIEHCHPEDACICIDHRESLERNHGIHFAPIEVAREFAFERVEPNQPTFGMHAFFNFDRVFGDAELAEYIDACDDALLFSIPARRLLRNCYRSGLTLAAGALHARRMRGPWSMRADALKLLAMAALGTRRRIT